MLLIVMLIGYVLMVAPPQDLESSAVAIADTGKPSKVQLSTCSINITDHSGSAIDADWDLVPPFRSQATSPDPEEVVWSWEWWQAPGPRQQLTGFAGAFPNV